jgi:Fic family protein
MDDALLALGRLDSVSALLPDPALFLYLYVRKEAVLSSQIEGTQSSLSDLLLFETDAAPGAPLEDVREVSSYVRALEHGMQRIRAGFPLSGRLLREVHRELLAHGRGSEKLPGEFRRSQNWIGGARPGVATFVPPPPEEVAACIADLEKFIHDDPERTPALLKAALAHVQFETIHPFLDGNGRLGRMLITLVLVAEGVLQQPLLYLSLHFKTHRSTYYELLQRVRTEGDWEAWVEFFVDGVRATAEEAVATARRLVQVFDEDRARILGFGRISGSALRVHLALQRHPIRTIRALAQETRLTVPTVTAALKVLEREGIVFEATGKQRGRVFAYRRYLEGLEEGTTTPFEAG